MNILRFGLVGFVVSGMFCFLTKHQFGIDTDEFRTPKSGSVITVVCTVAACLIGLGVDIELKYRLVSNMYTVTFSLWSFIVSSMFCFLTGRQFGIESDHFRTPKSGLVITFVCALVACLIGLGVDIGKFLEW